jgi:hypothetical protein
MLAMLVMAPGCDVVQLASSQHGPDDPCCLVGDRNRGSVEATSLPKLVDPLARRICLTRRGSRHSSGSVNDHGPERLGASLRDPHQHVPVAARVLARDQTEPDRQVMPFLEPQSIANGCSLRRQPSS